MAKEITSVIDYCDNCVYRVDIFCGLIHGEKYNELIFSTDDDKHFETPEWCPFLESVIVKQENKKVYKQGWDDAVNSSNVSLDIIKEAQNKIIDKIESYISELEGTGSSYTSEISSDDLYDKLNELKNSDGVGNLPVATGL